MSIAQNLLQIKSQLPENVTLVAVSKTKPVADMMEAYEAGQRVFGENKGKRTYLAVSPLTAAHASIFMGKQVVCCYTSENISCVDFNVKIHCHYGDYLCGGF